MTATTASVHAVLDVGGRERPPEVQRLGDVHDPHRERQSLRPHPWPSPCTDTHPNRCVLSVASEGHPDHGVLGGTGYLTIRVAAADGPSAGGWGRWCGPADGRPNGGHPDSVCGRVAAGAGEQRHADGGSGMGVDGVPRPVSPRVQRRSGPGNLGLFPPNGVLRHVDPLRWTQPSPTAMGRPTNAGTHRSKRTPPPTLRPL